MPTRPSMAGGVLEALHQMLHFTTIDESTIARLSTMSIRKYTKHAGSWEGTVSLASHNLARSKQQAPGKSVTRAGGASKRSRDVIS